METIQSSHKAYAYTVRCNTGEKAASYAPFFNKLKRMRIQVEYKVKEVGSCNVEHYHGVIYLLKGFYRKKLVTPGFHLKLVEIYNKDGWIKYIHKENPPPSDKQINEMLDEKEQERDQEFSEECSEEYIDDDILMAKRVFPLSSDKEIQT